MSHTHVRSGHTYTNVIVSRTAVASGGGGVVARLCNNKCYSILLLLLLLFLNVYNNEQTNNNWHAYTRLNRFVAEISIGTKDKRNDVNPKKKNGIASTNKRTD